MSNPIGKCFLIECRTGCSCCADENHIRGPFSSQAAAEVAIAAYQALPLLASQYARRGSYYIGPASFEQLPDGRLIIDNDRLRAGFVDNDPMSDDAIYHHTGN